MTFPAGRAFGYLVAVILFVVVMVAIQHSNANGRDKLYQSQIAACDRGNNLRRQLNNRATAQKATADGLIAFLSDAERARRAAYKRDRQQSDIDAARSYAATAARVKASARFTPVTIVDCEQTIPKP